MISSGNFGEEGASGPYCRSLPVPNLRKKLRSREHYGNGLVQAIVTSS